MFNSNNGYSLADIAAATGGCNGNGWGNDGNSWWIIIFILILCWGGNNRGGLFGGNDSTGSGITDGYILTSDFANIERKLDSVNNGICDGFYAMNTGMLICRIPMLLGLRSLLLALKCLNAAVIRSISLLHRQQILTID